MDKRLMEAPCIVFDVGNVLLTFEPEQVALLLPKEHRQPLFDAMFGEDWRWGAFDLGAETNEDIARSMAQKAQVPGGEKMVLYALHHFHETMHPLPLYHLIPELKQMGKKLYALTNYNEPAFSLARDAHENLKLLDGQVVSAREKMVKPDHAIFRLLQSRYGLIPENTLFIDDSESNVLSAAALGFRVWHYAGEDRL